MRVARLEQLPQKVDGLTGQILQLRDELGSEFSAVRRDMRDMRDDIVAQGRTELTAATAGLRDELIERIGEMHAVALKEIVDLGDRVDRGFAAMRQDLASFRHQMVAGIKAIQNRLPPH